MHTEATKGRNANGRSAHVASSNKTADSAPPGVSREFANFIADIEDLIESTTSLTGEELVQAKARVQARLAAARQSVQDLGVKLTDQTRDTVRGFSRNIHAQPWRAIGIVAGVTLLVGYLLGRRQ